METILAPCGILCNECPAYVATQAGDMEALAQVAEKWQTELGIPEITTESIICDGCLATEGRLCGNCFECVMRLCALEKQVATCAHCPDYVCDKLSPIFAQHPEARQPLDAIRAQLGG